MTKYYTPHLDEFYLGFEYFMKDNMESKQLKEDSILFTSVLDFDMNKVLVKYLDANDVISFGFNLIGESLSNNVKIFKKQINEQRSYNECEIRLTYQSDFPIISVIVNGEIIISDITCLNKSELRWILNRLKII